MMHYAQLLAAFYLGGLVVAVWEIEITEYPGGIGEHLMTLVFAALWPLAVALTILDGVLRLGKKGRDRHAM